MERRQLVVSVWGVFIELPFELVEQVEGTALLVEFDLEVHLFGRCKCPCSSWNGGVRRLDVFAPRCCAGAASLCLSAELAEWPWTAQPRGG